MGKEKNEDGQLALSFLYRRPTEEQMKQCEDIGEKVLDTARFLRETCGAGKNADKAIKALERARTCANAAILEDI